MMTNEEILQAALRQSAIDANCSPDDFLRESPVIVESKPNDCARKYLDLPLACDLISYGNNIVASIQPQYRDIVAAYIQKYPVEHCFETPNMHVLNDAFLPYNMQVCFMAEYFLPDVRKLTALDCGLQMRRCIRRISPRSISRSGKTRSVKSANTSMSSASVRMIMTVSWSVWQHVRRTVNRCGRSVLTFCPDGGAGELRRQ